MTTDYAAWSAMAKAQAVEQRVNAIMAAQSQGWTAVALFNSWTTFSGRTLMARVVDGGRSVKLSGQLSAGTTTDGTQIGFVGTGFQPLNRLEGLPVGQISASRTSFNAPYIEIFLDGTVTINSYGGTGGHIVIGGEYPLDAG